ncbi:MBL fold metallo-hydrolase [Phyllobacterium zundukense]|uniref:MBL fold metallo-hydrolase n=1 Tax=Phyllobacterium zundukense TaxID=1867719 RepID=A0A2N9VVG6_9HYPH|nr:MBL fold metallo-hydrolase [Phyllobacterium zundukense]ATU92959.1 MBL fold metallo-hydrolase [Phyllobacterium zundukense]PIO43484.1 MBL fold metallo-hydrolase [Phyllobacterium zundukense]
MTEIQSPTRRRFLGATASGLATPYLLQSNTFVASAFAQEAEAPSDFRVTRIQVGSFKITIVSDGGTIQNRPWETYGTDRKPHEVQALLKENFLPTDKFVVSYAPLIIDTGTEVILVDTGFGENGRPNGAGKMLAALQFAGYTPDQISLVFLTHLHRDHVGGLREAGAETFPKARYAVNATEFDFWVSEARIGSAAEPNHRDVIEKVKPLAPRISFVSDGEGVLPGITALAAPGHSPGHMILNIESDGRRVVLAADTVVHYALGLQRPNWEVRFDMDKPAAAATRKRVLDMIASDKVPFLGYHMPHPSIGFLDRKGDGYYFVPATYQFAI